MKKAISFVNDKFADISAWANCQKTRLAEVLSNDKGSGIVEALILVAVALVIAVALFAFRDKIVAFFNQAGKNVDGFTTDIT